MVGTVRFETLRGGIVRQIQAEFLAQVRESDRVHGAAILQQLV